MKALVIDDNRLIKAADLGLEDADLFYAEVVSTPREVAESAEALLKNANRTSEVNGAASETTVIFINLDLKLPNENRQYLKGIEILTWLRVNGILSHCVLYSLVPLDYIGSRKQQNLIVFAEGASFVRVPHDLRKLNLQELAKKTVFKENLKSFLRASFRLGEFRHRDANWWGMKQLADVYAFANAPRDRLNSVVPDYPPKVESELQILNNKVASYLHSVEAKDFGRYLEEWNIRLGQKKHELEEKQEAIAKHESDISAWEAQKEELDGEKTVYGSQTKDLEDALQASGLSKEAARHLRQVRIEERTKQERIETDIRFVVDTLSELREELATLAEEISAIENFWPEARGELGVDDEELRLGCNILLIDDQADAGWRELFGKVLNPQAIHSITPDRGTDTDLAVFFQDNVRRRVEKLKGDNKPLVLCLDIRLFDETKIDDLQEVSGIQMLRLIRAEFPGIPILTVSASNKREVFEITVKNGADAYWSKEGLDENFDFKRTINNYNRLRFLVRHLAGREYRTLRKLSEYSQAFNREARARYTWWSECAQELSSILADSAKVYKAHLHNSLLGYGSNHITQAFVLSGLINKLCGIYELIHQNKNDDETWRRFLTARNDSFGLVLMEARNEFSHASYADGYYDAEKTLENAVDRIVEYLSSANRPTHKPGGILQISK